MRMQRRLVAQVHRVAAPWVAAAVADSIRTEMRDSRPGARWTLSGLFRAQRVAVLKTNSLFMKSLFQTDYLEHE